MAPPFEATGDVLVAFYSDNLLSSLEYTLACAPAVLDEGRLEALEASAAGLRARKEALAAFGERFTVSFDDYRGQEGRPGRGGGAPPRVAGRGARAGR